MMPSQREAELEAIVTELREENQALHEQLAARDQTNAAILSWARRLVVRVAMLSGRSGRLLRLARYWRSKCPTRPLSDHLKAIMMVRYAYLGGLDRGKGTGAAEQVAAEFGVQISTVHRCIHELKYRSSNTVELAKLLEHYRLRYRDDKKDGVDRT
jgi:hypothetical protein